MMEYMKELRHWFHAHPELSGEERETSEKICLELKKMDIPYKKAANTSVIADIQGLKSGNGRTVILRADMDALPITEWSGAACRSLYEGKMHACGHDAHMAMLLGAAKELSERRNTFSGKVRLLFQEAEETLSGAKAVMAENVTEGAVCIMGMHVMAGMPVGTYHAPPSAIMSAGGGLEVRIKGMGGHASTPQNAVNPIVVLNEVITGVNGFLANKIDATDYFVMTPTMMSAGVKTNIIPDEGYLYYNWRYFDEKFEAVLNVELRSLIERIAQMCGAEALVKYIPKTYAVHNDRNCCRLLKEAAERRCSGTLQEAEAPQMGSEDFAFYLKELPGVFVLLGAMPADQVPRTAHNDCFDIHEDALEAGAGLYVEFALCALHEMD